MGFSPADGALPEVPDKLPGPGSSQAEHPRATLSGCCCTAQLVCDRAHGALASGECRNAPKYSRQLDLAGTAAQFTTVAALRKISHFSGLAQRQLSHGDQ
jgi:hypothetical protein